MADDSSPVLPDRKTMLFIERRLKEFKMQLGPMKRGPKRWPRKGGGGSASLDSKFAIVETSLNPGSFTGEGSTTAFVPGEIGTAWLMGWAWTGSIWRLTIPAGSAPIECVSAYTDITIPPGAFVHIDFSGDLTAGYDIDEGRKPPLATIVEDNEYRRQCPGYDPDEVQVFYHDASGVQRWNKVEC